MTCKTLAMLPMAAAYHAFQLFSTSPVNQAIADGNITHCWLKGCGTAGNQSQYLLYRPERHRRTRNQVAIRRVQLRPSNRYCSSKWLTLWHLQ